MTSTPLPSRFSDSGFPIKLPEGFPRDTLYEVVNGEWIVAPAMSAFAGRTAQNLYNSLRAFVRDYRLGSVDYEAAFVIDPDRDTRRRPDLAFVSVQRWPLEREIPEEGDWVVVPDLAVEVQSPSNTMEDTVKKFGDYFGCGVREVWAVLPVARKVFVFTSPDDVRIVSGTEDLTCESLIPGWRISLDELFRRSE